MCLAGLIVITAVNLWGIAESARVLMLPMVVFLAAIFGVIAVGLVRSHPAAVVGTAQPARVSEAGLLLATVLRASTGAVICTIPYRLTSRLPPGRCPTAALGRRIKTRLPESDRRPRVVGPALPAC